MNAIDALHVAEKAENDALLDINVTVLKNISRIFWHSSIRIVSSF